MFFCGPPQILRRFGILQCFTINQGPANTWPGPTHVMVSHQQADGGFCDWSKHCDSSVNTLFCFSDFSHFITLSLSLLNSQSYIALRVSVTVTLGIFRISRNIMVNLISCNSSYILLLSGAWEILN